MISTPTTWSFSFKRQLDKEHPFHGVTEGAEYEYFNGMSMPDLLKDVVKVDDFTPSNSCLNRPEAPMIANLGMDFASIHSKEYADKMMAAGITCDNRPEAGRHRTVPAGCLPEGCGHPLQGPS